MSRWKKIAIGVVLLGVGVFAALTWYKFTFSMDVAKPFEAGDASAQQRVLIATQGSDFKNAVVDGVVAELKKQPVFVKVIDVSGLGAVDASKWQVIVVLHTWESWKPPAAVKAFVDRTPDRANVIALATSGGGGEKLEDVDAIASASKMTDVPTHVAALMARIEALLAKQENSQ